MTKRSLCVTLSKEFRYFVIVPFVVFKKGECNMTFTYTNEDFEYRVSLDTVNNTFKASLADDLSINASGVTLEEAVFNLKSMI